MRPRRLWIILAACAAVALTAGAGAWVQRLRADAPPRLARAADYAESRLAVINYQLARAGPDHVLLAGDSNIELFGAAAGCGRPVVNAGVSGADVALYLATARRLAPTQPAQQAILTIGTNDLLRKRQPLSPESAARFAARAGEIVEALHARSRRLVVTAIPPIGELNLDAIEPRAVAVYSAVLEATCARQGCAFVDPFASERSDDFGVARSGVTVGLHLADYRRPYEGLLREACAARPD